MSLGAILPHNSSLCSLSLAANRLDSECVDFLVFGLYRNEALTYLDIGDNNFTANNMRKLGRALQCSSM
jgi:Ran GTPase-activating protein (RanGAP) involved in mRNA processing and transport